MSSDERMVKPLFAPSGEAVDRASLDDARHRPLFALIERISSAIGAPMHVRVQVDCSVNASARFVGGPFTLGRRELTVTMGLPLAAGLTTAQVAGVLAHEHGHFAQGAGMRLTYAVPTSRQRTSSR